MEQLLLTIRPSLINTSEDIFDEDFECCDESDCESALYEQGHNSYPEYIEAEEGFTISKGMEAIIESEVKYTPSKSKHHSWLGEYDDFEEETNKLSPGSYYYDGKKITDV